MNLKYMFHLRTKLRLIKPNYFQPKLDPQSQGGSEVNKTS